MSHTPPLPARRAASRPARVLGAAVAAAAGLALAACGGEQAGGEAAGQAAALPQVTVAAPVTRSVAVHDEVVGRFEAVSSVEIRAQVSGRLAAAHFRDGQTVAKGDPLFTIEQAPFNAALAQAQAELARAEAMGALAEQEQARAERLVSHDAISQEEFDQRMRGAEEAGAAIRAAQAGLEAARIDLGYTTITAPIDGRVSDRRVDPGNLVTANDSLLTTLVSQDPVYVTFSVPPEIAGALGRPGDDDAPASRIEFRLEGESEFTHSAEIDFVDNQVDPRTGVVRARAIADNPDGRFAPGQFVRVRFTRAMIADAVLVPETVVSSDQNFKFVLVVNADDVVEPRPIQSGPVVDGMRVVEAGLSTDDRIIVGGGQTAYPGMQVAPTPATAEMAAR